jgi:hypothetical protein
VALVQKSDPASTTPMKDAKPPKLLIAPAAQGVKAPEPEAIITKAADAAAS